ATADHDPLHARRLYRLAGREPFPVVRSAPPRDATPAGRECVDQQGSGGMSALLEATSLSKHFGGLKAVDDLSLTVEQGELHCLIGPNGAGKSTFFWLILGRYRPTAGTVRFRGEDITGLQAAARIR